MVAVDFSGMGGPCKSTKAKINDEANSAPSPKPRCLLVLGAEVASPTPLPLADVCGCLWISVLNLSPASQLCLGPPSVTGQRVDFYSLIDAIWLIYLLHLQQRKAIAEVWPRYRGFLVSLMIFQYFLPVRLPPALCKGKPNHLHALGSAGAMRSAGKS